jgi:hypothetical protein
VPKFDKIFLSKRNVDNGTLHEFMKSLGEFMNSKRKRERERERERKRHPFPGEMRDEKSAGKWLPNTNAENICAV